MENLPEKIRIKDIARMAGVSAGSVDRIIHNRGNVSKKSKEKILAVMKEINYKPNAIASALASKKKYKIACFLPDTKESEYWSLVVEGIKHAENELSDFNFKATYIHFNQFDENSFIEESKKLFEEGISGVLMVPAFKEESKKIILQLQEKEIPFSFIDTVIEDCDFLSYYGQHSLQSGYVAARLLFSEVEPNKDIYLLKTQTLTRALSNQIDNRMRGFNKYCAEHHITANIKEIEIQLHDEKSLNEQLDQTFKGNQNIGACIIFNSRAYLIANYLEQNDLKGIKLFGYDTIKRNIDYLQKGTITGLIGQQPKTQGYKGLKSLSEQLIFKHTPPHINFMPIEILIKENIDYFVDME